MTPSDKIRELLREVMADHRIGSEDFFSAFRERHLVAARMDAAHRLRKGGYSICHIGRILKRDHSTVRYYLDGKTYVRKAQRHAAQYIPRYIDDDSKRVIKQVAAKEGVKPYIIVGRWVTERARAAAGELA